MPQSNETPTLSMLKQIIASSMEPDLSGHEKAQLITSKAIERIQAQFGGQQIYIPSVKYQALKQRDALIVKAFTGLNHADLCKQFNITRQRLYQILKSHSHKEKSNA